MNYTIVRSHRRTMAIQIKRDGRVVVRAPYAATDEEVRQLVEKHRGWIEKAWRARGKLRPHRLRS